MERAAEFVFVERNDVVGKKLQSVDFYGKTFAGDFSNIEFSGANMTKASFNIGCLLMGAKFIGTQLQNASFSHIQATGADFTKANLTGATIVNCNFTDAIFEDAILESTHFVDCTFTRRKKDLISNENLSFANVTFRNCTVTGLEETKTYNGTLDGKEFSNVLLNHKEINDSAIQKEYAAASIPEPSQQKKRAAAPIPIQNNKFAILEKLCLCIMLFRWSDSSGRINRLKDISPNILLKMFEIKIIDSMFVVKKVTYDIYKKLGDGKGCTAVVGAQNDLTERWLSDQLDVIPGDIMTMSEDPLLNDFKEIKETRYIIVISANIMFKDPLPEDSKEIKEKTCTGIWCFNHHKLVLEKLELDEESLKVISRNLKFVNRVATTNDVIKLIPKDCSSHSSPVISPDEGLHTLQYLFEKIRKNEKKEYAVDYSSNSKYSSKQNTHIDLLKKMYLKIAISHQSNKFVKEQVLKDVYSQNSLVSAHPTSLWDITMCSKLATVVLSYEGLQVLQYLFEKIGKDEKREYGSDSSSNSGNTNQQHIDLLKKRYLKIAIGNKSDVYVQSQVAADVWSKDHLVHFHPTGLWDIKMCSELTIVMHPCRGLQTLQHLFEKIKENKDPRWFKPEFTKIQREHIDLLQIKYLKIAALNKRDTLLVNQVVIDANLSNSLVKFHAFPWSTDTYDKLMQWFGEDIKAYSNNRNSPQ